MAEGQFICVVTGVFGGRRNSVSGAVAILKVFAEEPLIHFKIGRIDFFRIFIKLL